ncbi:MAG: rhomboid family intramembrane serine protease [Caulobacteraceae bacterium]
MSEPSQFDPPTGQDPPHEPAFNAPAAAVALVVLILASYALQIVRLQGEAAGLWGGFSLPALEEGRWWTLFTHMFIHGGWVHAGMNALGALAFGPPVARLLGSGPRGWLLFAAFFLATGVIAALGFGLIHWSSPAVMIGASGATSGLMGAASRLYAQEEGAMAPLLGRQPLGMLAGWTAANVLIGLTRLSPGMEGAVIAWDAHIIGFVAGMVLISPFARLAR